jgi:hypothetical protein
MTQNHKTAVEERDGMTHEQKKYITVDGKVVYGPFVWNDDTDGEPLSDEEFKELLDELIRHQDENLPEIDLDQAIRDSIAAYSQISMFDYGTGEMSSMQAMADFYGWPIVNQIQKEKEDSYNHKLKDQPAGHISKKLWKRIKDIRAGRIPKAESKKSHDPGKPSEPRQETPTSEPEDPPETQSESKEKPKIRIEKRERQKGDDYFLPLERGIIRNETYRKLFKGPGVVYEWIWANLVRDQWRDSKAYPVKEKYYDKGYLAYCSTYRKIAKECGMSKNTVRAFIKGFEEAGIIVTKNYCPDGKTQGQTVFILGTWTRVNGVIVESLYRDAVFISPKPVKN